jgi:para-nitrobenzyl esterase
MDAKQLMLATTRYGFAPWGAVDGELLPDQLISVFSRGEQAQVPILTGFNQGEIRSLRALAPPAPDLPADYEQMITSRYGQDAEKFLQLYPSSNVEESILATTRDAIYGWSSRKLAEVQSAILLAFSQDQVGREEIF